MRDGFRSQWRKCRAKSGSLERPPLLQPRTRLLESPDAGSADDRIRAWRDANHPPSFQARDETDLRESSKKFLHLRLPASSILIRGGQGRLKPSPGNFFVASTPSL